MKLCPYCNQKISFFGTLFGGIDHTECNSEAIKHQNFLRNYLRKEVMLGGFNKIAPKEFAEAQKFLSGTLEAEEAMAAGFDDAVEEMCDDISLDDQELQKIDTDESKLQLAIANEKISALNSSFYNKI